MALIILSIVLLRRIRNLFDDAIYKLLIASTIFSAGAEIAFTTYIGVYDAANMAGHLFKLASFYLVYRAIFVTAVRDPFSIVFKELKKKEELLIEAYASMEKKVQEQTRDLNIILDNSPFGISKIIDRKQVMVNRKIVNLFQYSKDEMENQTTRKLYPSDEAYEKLGQEAYPALFSGQVYETLQELVRKDGAHIKVRYVGQAVDP
ncbi:MAG: MASE3 domain-containing protein, partial [Deltaproteobacteria bacterium]